MCRTCSALVPHLFRTCSALVPHLCRNVGGSAARCPLAPTAQETNQLFRNNFPPWRSLRDNRRGCLQTNYSKAPPAGFGGPIAPHGAPPHPGPLPLGRRTAGPASARKSSPPCPHRLHGLFRARCPNAMSRCFRALPFASFRRSLTRTPGHLQWPEPPRFVHATAPAQQRLKRPRHRAIRSLDRYEGARAIRDSPSDVAACHRVVRRHTCCPATRRSTRATQARATPGVIVGQPAPKAASELSHEARRSSEKCVRSPESHRPNYESPRFVMVSKFSFSFCLVLVILASHFRGRIKLPNKNTTWSPAYISETKPHTAVVDSGQLLRRDKVRVVGV